MTFSVSYGFNQDNDPEKPITKYEMNVHLFGSISSPAVATFSLRMVAENCKASLGGDVTEFIHIDLYVDDGLTSSKAAETLFLRRSYAATRSHPTARRLWKHSPKMKDPKN